MKIKELEYRSIIKELKGKQVYKVMFCILGEQRLSYATIKNGLQASKDLIFTLRIKTHWEGQFLCPPQ